MQDQSWMSIIDYARRFQISDMTVRRRIKTGKIQAVLRDGKYYIPYSEIERRLHKKPTPGLDQPVPHTRPSNYETHVVMQPSPVQTKVSTYQEPQQHVHYKNIPDSISQPLQQASVGVSGSDLLKFCNNAIDIAIRNECANKDRLQGEIARLMAEVSSRDSKIQILNEKVEDLQVLVKLLEKKSSQQRSSMDHTRL